MKELVQHPVYGEIIFNQSFWTDKKTLTVNGVAAQPISKNEFIVNGKIALIKNNGLTGIDLYIEGETIQVSPKAKWYESFLAFFPFVFLMTWGNSASLCAIFPVIGGAIGGGLGALGGSTSLLLMKKQKKSIAKVLVGIGVATLTILIAFILAVALIFAMV